MPHRFPQSHPIQPVDAPEYSRGAHDVEEEDHNHNIAGNPPQPLHPVGAHSVPGHQSLGQCGTLPEQSQQEGGGRHKAQASHQHQEEDDGLPEAAPVGRCIDYCVAGHCYGGYGGEEGCYRVGESVLVVGHGQRQQQASEHYQKDESHKQDVRRAEHPVGSSFGYRLRYPRPYVPEAGLAEDRFSRPGRLIQRQRGSPSSPARLPQVVSA